jgi:hypothetical protein
LRNSLETLRYGSMVTRLALDQVSRTASKRDADLIERLSFVLIDTEIAIARCLKVN